MNTRSAVAAIALVLVSAFAAQAEEDVVVIANKSAPVEKIDAQQVTQIFLKQIQTWPDGKPISPVDLKEGAPLRAEFYSKITGRSAGQLRAYWARQEFTGMGFPPKQVASAADVTKFVQSTPSAVGYVSRKAADSSVKILLDVDR
jgi:ABC-type phosphate transport system substrate-binding protein